MTAINLNTGEHLWMKPMGNGDRVRNHPLLRDLDLPPLGGDSSRAGPLVTMGVFPLLKSLLPVVVAFLLPTTDTLDHRRVGNGTHRHGLFQEPMEELPAMA